ncbi:MAG: response regulator, partial [Myxococcales bacterium]
RRRHRRATEPLRELFQRLDLARRNALSRADAVSRELAEARGRLSRLALVPAGEAFSTMERAARLAAAELGKSIRVEASGGEVRIDRHVLPIINNALLHVIRNAVDHGIESPHTRAARAKASEGRIRLSVERRGSRVAFVCEDDGAGIDAAEVRRIAVERGWLSLDEANQLDDAAALRLLFRAGVSTRSEVTNWSGRGVGLDVVNAVAASLRGHATISSRLGLGTRVELVVPVSLSTATVLSLQVGEGLLLMPLDVVRRVSRVPATSLHQSERGESLVLDDELLPVLRLGQILEGSSQRQAAGMDPVVLVVAVGDERCAVLADAVLDINEVTVRPLPWAAGSPTGIAGAALDAEGVSRLVLDPRGLITILQQHSASGPVPKPAVSVKRYLPILVIDDSLTTRMLEQSILQTAGFEVDVATSAEEGLSMATGREYGLFVVDVEMPGMNGFEFTAMTRSDPRFRETPVVLVTSLSSEADQARGRDAGASAYVVKGQFDQDHFLNQIRTLSRTES